MVIGLRWPCSSSSPEIVTFQTLSPEGFAATFVERNSMLGNLFTSRHSGPSMAACTLGASPDGSLSGMTLRPDDGNHSDSPEPSTDFRSITTVPSKPVASTSCSCPTPDIIPVLPTWNVTLLAAPSTRYSAAHAVPTQAPTASAKLMTHCCVRTK